MPPGADDEPAGADDGPAGAGVCAAATEAPDDVPPEAGVCSETTAEAGDVPPDEDGRWAVTIRASTATQRKTALAIRNHSERVGRMDAS